MKEAKRILITLLLVITLNMLWVVPAVAATSATVTVTYTVEYLDISDNVTTYDFGLVATSSETASLTAYFGVTDSSSVQTDNTISVTGATWTNGTAHTHSNTATPGADTVGVKASDGDAAFDVVVETDAGSPNYIKENNAAGADWSYEIKLYAPTSTSDGVEKTNTLKITVAAG